MIRLIRRLLAGLAGGLVVSLLASVPACKKAKPAPPGSGGLEILIAPRGFLIAKPAKRVGVGYQGVSPYYDLVLQTIFFANKGKQALTLGDCWIEVLSGKRVLQRAEVPRAEIARASKMAVQIREAKLQVGLDVHYSATATLPAGVTLTSSLTLKPGTAALVDDNLVVVRALPDAARVTCEARQEKGARLVAHQTIPVREYRTKNSYIFPVEPGDWFVLAFPGVKGHHRWTAATEHGYDITMVDRRGSWAMGATSEWRTGRVKRWDNWYAYDKKVLAAADGVVVKVRDDVKFPLKFWNRRDGETLSAWKARIGKKQMELFRRPGADPFAVAGGNHILIKHAGGEYSYYAHLAYGRVLVKKGQRVVQGQHIAGLGGTGEEPMVHLHFQVSDSPSTSSSRTLPVWFTNVEVNTQSVHPSAPTAVGEPGFFVIAKPTGNLAPTK